MLDAAQFSVKFATLNICAPFPVRSSIDSWVPTKEELEKKVPCPHEPVEPIMRTIFKFALDPEKCIEATADVFKKALDATSGIEQVERTLMDRLFWSHRPVIASVQCEFMERRIITNPKLKVEGN